MFFSQTKSKQLSNFLSFGLQIVEQTPTILKLQDKGAANLQLLLTIPCVLVGLLNIIFLGKLTTLKCARLEATKMACELTTSSLLGGDITPILGQLRGAEVEVGSGRKVYRIALLTKNNSIPMTEWYSLEEEDKRKK